MQTQNLTNNIQISISNFASILNVHQRTLRIWDKERILVPERTRKNRRYYSIEDIEKAKVILFLTGNLLVNLSAVKIILGLLERNKIDIKEYINYVNEIASLVDIGKEKQEENLKKNARRGRKKKEQA